MIKDVVSFIISGKKFVADFQKTPIILSAEEFIDVKLSNNESIPRKFKFENVDVEILDISSQLGVKNVELTKLSKILVGEIDNKLFGVLVDSVIEIINLNDDLTHQVKENQSQELLKKEVFVEISGERLRFLDIYDCERKNVSNFKRNTNV